MIYSVYITNKAGSLLYNADFNGAPALATNERITLFGLFHGICAFAGQLSPSSDNSGIRVLDAESFRLHRFRSPTGMQFIAVADRYHQSLEGMLRKVYQAYADYVAKNPFYSIDMPIRCQLFNEALKQIVEYSDRMSGSYDSRTA